METELGTEFLRCFASHSESQSQLSFTDTSKEEMGEDGSLVDPKKIMIIHFAPPNIENRGLKRATQESEQRAYRQVFV